MTTFSEVLESLRIESRSEREKGTLFEDLMEALLPQLPDRSFDKVWAWRDWPDRKRLTGMDAQDVGIDLVGQLRDTGEYCAIQCKFYDERRKLNKAHIDSFFTASGSEPFAQRLIIATTDDWSKHAENAAKNQQIPVTLMRLADLETLEIDWDIVKPQKTLFRPSRNKLYSHQEDAVSSVINGFKKHDRGKLIMACGTGKTFTALHITQKMTPKKGGYVLFIVPSIALMSQTLREWAYQRECPHRYLAVCSDAQVDKNEESGRVEELAIPATTDARRIAAVLTKKTQGTTVVFSTYQSLERIKEAQRLGAPDFDLVICDEAHRTTGVEGNQFANINKPDYVKAQKQLYMTATPRLYTESAKRSAKTRNIDIYSMDDESIYGPEFYRLDFSRAVSDGLLSDFRVIIFNVNEEKVSREIQAALTEDGKLRLEDAAKIVGCYKALRDQGEKDGIKLKRAVSFSGTIKHSKLVEGRFRKVIEELDAQEDDGFTCEISHVDGTDGALKRNSLLDWLRKGAGSNEHGEVCHILSNARCLTEGVDVPSLDAVMFMSPRKSKVDIVQAVGRVMRKSKNKKYGYIILPVVIPSGILPEDALNDNKVYGVVWDVLNALRSHDDRFNATINQIELNRNKPDQIKVIGYGFEEREGTEATGYQDGFHKPFQHALQLGDLELAIYAKLVDKVGDRKYWETWAKDVAKIYKTIVTRIDTLRFSNANFAKVYDQFLKGIQDNVNKNLTEQDAISMLAQHLITRPVFDALFQNYSFSRSNPVSQAMNSVLEEPSLKSIDHELDTMERFYDSVRDRAYKLDNPEARQTVIIELYEKFFKTAFPKTSESLGIAYTPIEIVDFVLKSADHALHQEFGCRLTDENVHIIDPFTGTGSFMSRLLQTNLIKDKDLLRKFSSELHANEILLLAYYIASVNIEESYHGRTGKNDYESFPGIVLTDTFNLFEGNGGNNSLDEAMFPENNARVKRQRAVPIRVIVGNPPWSVGQKSENDDAKNMDYPKLDFSIRENYAKQSKATAVVSLYDSYIRAFRWASDRIRGEGIIAFVSNGGWLDGKSTDGFRKCLAGEFSKIYVFHLRGNQRTSGERSRKEGGKIFGSGSRAPVTITILVKSSKSKEIGKIFFYDIGNYISRREKLDIIAKAKHIGNLDWQLIIPDKNNDWINQRDPLFDTFKPLGSKRVKSGKMVQPDTVFRIYGRGVATSRDAWVYNYSKGKLIQNMQAMIGFYNEQLGSFQKARKKTPSLEVDEFIDNNPTKIKWDRRIKKGLRKNTDASFENQSIYKSLYRPFNTQFMYFNKYFNNEVYQQPLFFPSTDNENQVICVTGEKAGKDFSPLITNRVPNLHFLDTSQCFPRYYWRKESGGGGGGGMKIISLIHV